MRPRKLGSEHCTSFLVEARSDKNSCGRLDVNTRARLESGAQLRAAECERHRPPATLTIGVPGRRERLESISISSADLSYCLR